MKRRRSNTLVALSSAAVMTVYAAGFMRTRAAAERLEHASRERPPVLPAAASASASAAIETPLPTTTREAVAAKASPEVRTKNAVALKSNRESVDVAALSSKSDKSAKTDKVEKVEEPAPAKAEPVAPAAVMPDAVPTPATPPPSPASPSAEILLGGTELRDGTYLGWGSSRHGDIQASVTILSGRITAVSIAQCRTRYSCDVIAHLPAKVVKDQTPEKLNNVSGATQSVDAFYYAVVDAMSKAK